MTPSSLASRGSVQRLGAAHLGALRRLERLGRGARDAAHHGVLAPPGGQPPADAPDVRLHGEQAQEREAALAGQGGPLGALRGPHELPPERHLRRHGGLTGVGGAHGATGGGDAEAGEGDARKAALGGS